MPAVLLYLILCKIIWGLLRSGHFHTGNGPHQSFLVVVVDTNLFRTYHSVTHPSVTAVFTPAQVNRSLCGPTWMSVKTSLTHTGILGVSPIIPGCRHHNQPLALYRCSAVPTPRLLPRSPTAGKEEVGNKMAGAYRATPRCFWAAKEMHLVQPVLRWHYRSSGEGSNKCGLSPLISGV